MFEGRPSQRLGEQSFLNQRLTSISEEAKLTASAFRVKPDATCCCWRDGHTASRQTGLQIHHPNVASEVAEHEQDLVGRRDWRRAR
jgi:hypothetical protein